jgi:hypothetical protein
MGILNFFFEEGATSTPNKVEDSKSHLNQIPTLGNNPTQPVLPTNHITPQNSPEIEKFIKHFDELFEKANLPGPDYFEFSKMVSAMEELPDNVKFKSSFIGLKVSGLTKEKLITTAQTYIDFIDADHKNFVIKVNEEVDKQKNQLIEVEKTINAKNEMIKKLQEEVGAHIVSMTEIQSTQNKIMEKAEIYKSACEDRKVKIKQDMDKINTYITN